MEHLQVGNRDIVLVDERHFEVERVRNTKVRRERELSLREDEDRAVCASPIRASAAHGKEAGYGAYPMLASLFEKPMASWNTTRKAVWAESPQPSMNMFVWMSSKMGNRTQQAALAVLLTPSAHVTLGETAGAAANVR